MSEQFTPATPPASPAKAKKAWYKRTWVIAVITGVVCLGIGAASAGSTDPKTTPAFKALVAKQSQTQDDLKARTTERDVANSKLTTMQGTLPGREAAVTDKEAKLATREAAVAAKEKSVSKREKAVGIVEKDIAANTVSGDGVYKVGSDIKAGTYKTSGSTGCYYAVLNSTDTTDIATNNNVDGPAFVTVRPGQYFQTQTCADWVIQR